jgi:hypothetical protein
MLPVSTLVGRLRRMPLAPLGSENLQAITEAVFPSRGSARLLPQALCGDDGVRHSTALRSLTRRRASRRRHVLRPAVRANNWTIDPIALDLHGPATDVFAGDRDGPLRGVEGLSARFSVRQRLVAPS